LLGYVWRTALKALTILSEGKMHMRLFFFVLLLPAALGGCLSFSSSTPPRTTVVVPAQPGQAVAVCANGYAPPC
jgi:hypothetical protein